MLHVLVLGIKLKTVMLGKNQLAPIKVTNQRQADLNLTYEVQRLNGRIDSLVTIIGLLNPAKPSLNTEDKKPSKKKTKAVSTVSKSLYSAPVQKSTASSYTGYCHGITKKGYKCSRRVKSGLYCWQHGG